MNTKKGLKKLGCIIFAAVVVLVLLVLALDDRALDELKFNLGLWTIIVLVLIINVVSFISFMVMYLAYRWVKQDFDDRSETDSDDTSF